MFRQGRFAGSYFMPLYQKAMPQVMANVCRSGRKFWTSSRLNQRYRYVRFGDPFPNGSYQERSAWQALWARFTPGQKLILVGVGGGAPLFYVSHLETVEQTGRRRFIFMSPAMEESFGEMVLGSIGCVLTLGIQRNNGTIPKPNPS